MDGVTILNTIENNDIRALSFLVIVILVMLAILGIMYFLDTKSKSVLTVSILNIILAILFSLTLIKPQQPQIQYQVTISDSVSFTEFTNKYKVISQDGQIYTVVEKEN